MPSIYSLPEDCFYEIIKHIKDDINTLCNCLFVNRFLCKIIVPFLYQNPFSVINEIRKYYCLTRTFLTFLNEEERNYLNEHFIKIPKESFSLFDYTKYLEEIPNLTIAVECWLIYQSENSNEELIYLNYHEYINQLDENKKLILQKTLFHLFLRKIKNCKVVNIQANLFNTRLFNIQFFKDVISYNSNISSLHLIVPEGGVNESSEELFFKFISLVAKKCFAIEELKIMTSNFYYSSILQGLIEFVIQKQKNFKRLILSYPNDRSLNEFVKVIALNKRTLTSVHIDHSCSLIDQNILRVIAKCKRIEKLEFINVKGLAEMDTEKIFCNSTFELKELINPYENSEPFFHVHLGGLVRKFGSLNRLSLHKVTSLIINHISEFCLNLKILQIGCEDIDYQHFKNMKIEQLIIYSEESLSLNYYGTILKSMAENLPYSLDSFTIYIKDPNREFLSEICCISSNNLEMFLNNLRINLNVFNCNFNLKIENLEQIVNCLEKQNSLRYLGIGSPPGSFRFNNNKVIGMQLLNKIREFGIEIITIKK